MPDDARRRGVVFVLIFLNEVESARKRDAAEIFFKLFGAHSDAVIGDRQRSRFAVDRDIYAVWLRRLLCISERYKAFSLRYRIGGV